MTLLFDALRWLGILFLVLMLFNLVIVVHECGHFLAARWRGLKIEKFQIWFGKCIWKKTINGVQYGLGTIPFGGFVALPQMADMSTIEGASQDGNKEVLKKISPLDKIIVAFAGPLFSFLLAIAFAFIVWGVGKPESSAETEAVIGYISPDSPAARSDLKIWDRVVAIDGKPVKRFAGPVDSVMWHVLSSEQDDIVFSVLRNDQPVEVKVHAPTAEDKDFIKWNKESWFSHFFKRAPMRRVGIMFPTRNLEIKELLDNSPAKLAGMKAGDVLRKLNGQDFLSFIQLFDALKAKPEAPLEFVIERAGAIMPITVIPRQPDEGLEAEAHEAEADDEPQLKTDIGIKALDDRDAEARKLAHTDIKHPTPYEQISDSLRTTFSTLAALVSSKSSVQPGHMSSALGIISIYHQLFGLTNGWMLILAFTVVLNVNLAVLNMLPLPVLDGGHITMALIEAVGRRPLRGRVVEYIQASFAVMLLSFMVFVMLKDVGSWGGKGKEIKFYPPKDGAAQVP